MSKLFRLKKWLTLPDAARHLSIVLDEPVSEADVLRLALDRHLKLSIDFVNSAVGKPAKVIPLSEAKIGTGLAGERVVFAQRISEHEYLLFDENPVSLQGVWDLPLIGAETLDLKHRYQQLTAGPEVTNVDIGGAFVEGRDGQLFQLQECFKKSEDKLDSLFPAGGLPEDSVLIVRTEALRTFEQSISGAPADVDRPLATRERRTLLTVIRALCDECKIVPGAYGAAKRIAGATDRLGASVSDSKIGTIFEQLEEAVDARKK